jgi:hypothetical protein
MGVRISASLLLVCSLAVTSSGQIAVTQIQAERVALLTFADPNAGPQAQISVGLLSTADSTALNTQVQTFNTAYQSLVSTYNSSLANGGSPDPTVLANARDAAVQLAFSNLQTQLSIAGWSALEAFMSDYQTNGMISGGSGDIVFAHKYFGNGAGNTDGDDPEDGYWDWILADGESGAGNSCSVTSENTSQVQGNGVWYAIGGGTGTLTSLSAAGDGTLVIRDTTGGIYVYSEIPNTWSQLPGAGKEISAGSIDYIYVVGTDSKVYWLNPSTSAWQVVNGAPTVAQHVAGSPDGSLAVSNGAVAYLYMPGVGWKTFPTLSSNIVSLAAVHTGGIQYPIYSIDAVLANGAMENGIYQNGTMTWYTSTWSGITGTPLMIQDGIDGSQALLDYHRRVSENELIGYRRHNREDRDGCRNRFHQRCLPLHIVGSVSQLPKQHGNFL